MNKNMALTVVGVILLGMALVAYNEYSTEPKATESSTQAALEVSKPSSAEDAKDANQPAQQAPATETKPSSQALTPPTAPANANDWSKNAPLAPAAPSPIAPTAEASAPMATPPPTAEQAKPTAPEAPKAEQIKTEQVKAEETKQVASTEAKKPDPAKAEEPKATPAKVEKKPTQAPKSTAKEIKKISILSIGDGTTVRIDSTQVPAYKSMQLKNPPRIVLDLTGDWKVKAPGVPKNEFVSNVRIGEQKDGTRIVIDLKKTPASIRYLKYGDNGLDVRIR